MNVTTCRARRAVVSVVVSAAVAVAWLGAGPVPRASAVGEAANRFGVFVPASAFSGRYATLIVTAVSDNTTVTITDAPDDGDSDDTVTGLALGAGQSHIVTIRNGAVNDDLGGKQDGDFFMVESDRPVLVVNLTVNTDWEHAFVPADNHRMTGTSFYLYRPVGFANAHFYDCLLNAFAYNDNTEVRVIDITSGSGVISGTTRVAGDALGAVVLSSVLNAGQDLLEVKQKRARLFEGRTYHIVSSDDIAVQFGSLCKGRSGSRDGGAYVPGKSGYSADRVFYFTLPFEQRTERELRIVSYDQAANVTVRGWNTDSARWDPITSIALDRFDHAELVGAALGTYAATTAAYYFFEVTSNATVSVFETNWLETGSYGTSDIATFISSKDGTGAGTYFQAYLGPPASHPYTSTKLSHLIVSAHLTATVEVADADSYGEYVELYNNTPQVLDLGGWTLTNGRGQAALIPPGTLIRPGDVLLLEYHARATSAPAGFVYGADYPGFRLANGGETIVLRRPDTSLADSLVYTATGWGAHGIYRSLERRDPNRPFTAANAADGAWYTPAGSTNLGDYYGSPGAHTGQPGLLTGTVVINEIMAGRIFSRFTVRPSNYADFSLNSAEWEGLHNGEKPQFTSSPPERPENPYLIVQSDAPVSVMNANWNDNWMTYATGVLRPDPEVNLLADRAQYRPGDPIRLLALGTNYYGDLRNPVTTIDLPPGFLYAPGNYATSPQLAGVTPSQTQRSAGAWRLTWSLTGTLAAGVANRQRIDITGTVAPTIAYGSLLQMVATLRGADAAGQLYASQDTAVANISANQPLTVASPVLVNEVMAAPGCAGNEWIELVNRGTSDLPIGGYELANADGLLYRFPAGLPDLRGNSYLVVYLSDGQDVTATQPMRLYAGAGLSGALRDEEDQAALFNGSLRIPLAMLDFMRWDTDTLVSRPGDLSLAVDTKHWLSAADRVEPAPAGRSLSRRVEGAVIIDTHSSADWVAGTPTPGQLNNPALPMPVPSQITRLAAMPLLGQEGAIRLTWTNPITNFDEVQIVRALSGYPARLGDGTIVYAGAGDAFTDIVTASVDLQAAAQALTALGAAQSAPLVYYAAFTFKSGAIACATADAQTRAIPPHRVMLSFEDQKGSAWSDWDTNDLVVAQDTAVQLDRDGVRRVEALFKAQARGAAYDHTLYWSVPIAGAAEVRIERYDRAGAPAVAEASSASGAVTAAVFTSTHEALPSNPGGFTANTMSGTVKVEGLAARVTITLAEPGLNPVEAFGAPPYDPWLYVHDTRAAIHLVQAGSIGNSQMVANPASPLHQRDLPLALSFNRFWQWPLEEHPIWNAYPRYSRFITSAGQLDADWFLHPDPTQLWATYSRTTPYAGWPAGPQRVVEGSLLAGWPQTMSGAIFASPVMADVDGDGTVELIGAAQTGEVTVWDAGGQVRWTRQVGQVLRSSPSVGDVDGDGAADIVIGSGDGKLYAWHGDGSLLAGFPIPVDTSIKSSIALANLDADAALEMAFQAGDAKVHLFNGNGTPLPGWPVSTGGATEAFGNLVLVSTPAIGDVDGDGQADIVVGATDRRVHALRLDGTPLSWLWPRPTGDWVYGSPVIVDLDEDGAREVVAASGDGYLYVWAGNGLPKPGFPARLGGGAVSSPAVFDLDGDGDLEIVVATVAGQVVAVHHTGQAVEGWPREAGATVYSSPAAADIDSDGYPEVLIGSHDGWVRAWNRAGAPVAGWPKQTGDWVVSTPALGDLDGDGRMDVAVGSFDGRMYVWPQDGAAHSTAVAWGAFRLDARQNAVVAAAGPLKPPPAARAWFLPLVSHR